MASTKSYSLTVMAAVACFLHFFFEADTTLVRSWMGLKINGLTVALQLLRLHRTSIKSSAPTAT